MPVPSQLGAGRGFNQSISRSQPVRNASGTNRAVVVVRLRKNRDRSRGRAMLPLRTPRVVSFW